MRPDEKRLTLDEFMQTTRPVWIQHLRHAAYNGWAMYDRMVPGGLIRIEMIRAGALLLSSNSYGSEWAAYRDRPSL